MTKVVRVINMTGWWVQVPVPGRQCEAEKACHPRSSLHTVSRVVWFC